MLRAALVGLQKRKAELYNAQNMERQLRVRRGPRDSRQTGRQRQPASSAQIV
jgi:hypothetical protein